MTLGHWDLIERSAEIFQNLILGVTTNPAKDPMFSTEERMDMARDVVKGLENVEVDTFEGLLIDYAKLRGSRVLIRGLRAYSDFEYEFQMALTNRKLAPEIETLFMMPKEIHSYVSSSTVREVARFGGDVSEFVPSSVLKVIGEKLGHGGAG
ncbi:MAG: pantetheine-phosphate adenylyltransferase [Kiritimatiellia bacterium]|jgi:pantetheine-phosphate adenylyltransferase|nr:pantetheine-phosphate adenylyltransferase [Kiritimatiellia bacterium]